MFAATLVDRSLIDKVTMWHRLVNFSVYLEINLEIICSSTKVIGIDVDVDVKGVIVS